MSKLSHQDRTSHEGRGQDLHMVQVVDVHELLDAGVRLIRLGKLTSNQHIKARLARRCGS